MSNVLVIAPHPDDEVLGCGGTMLKHKANGDNVNWLIVTHISEEQGFSVDRIISRNEEIKKVALEINFNEVFHLKYPTAQLDTITTMKLRQGIGDTISKVQAEILYIPYRGDIHSDHRIVFDASISCTKWFRYPSIKKVLVYETLSETDFIMNMDANGFRPNVFVDISHYIEKKIDMMKIYEFEMGLHPFPRSEEAIRALATLRGAASGFNAAESFMLVKERIL